MSRNFQFRNPDGVYFVSFSTVYWLKVFRVEEYKHILINNLRYSQNKKGLEVLAWCIMENHIHLIFRVAGPRTPGEVLGGFKRFTCKAIVKAMIAQPSLYRNSYWLNVLQIAGRHSSNVKNYQLWQHHNHPIEIWSKRVMKVKMNYVHQNPVKANLVQRAEDYLFSSAIDYAGGKGLLKLILVD